MISSLILREKSKSLLSKEYRGDLKVIIIGLGDFTNRFAKAPLINYIDHAYACLSEEAVLETRPEDWEVISFSRLGRTITVKKILLH